MSVGPGKETRLFVTGEIKDAVEAASWRWKALDTAMKVAMPLLLGISAWTATTLLDHDKRLSHIEATRYTQRDADGERRRHNEQRAQISLVLSEIKVILARIEESDKATAKRLDKIEAKLEGR